MTTNYKLSVVKSSSHLLFYLSFYLLAYQMNVHNNLLHLAALEQFLKFGCEGLHTL